MRADRIAPAFFLTAVTLLGVTAAQARGTYQEPEAFVREAYAGAPPAPETFWLTEPVQAEVKRILGHRYPVLRLRYWRRADRSAWILEEIGKEQPITVGIVIDGGEIELVRVLVFRESRGDEVRHGFFTRQFHGAQLAPDTRLDRPIDGISGASLSVRAVTDLARLALYLHGRVTP